jgi:SAM-dependent methyltransferase
MKPRHNWPTTEAQSQSRTGPLRAALDALLRAAPQPPPRIEKIFWRMVYEGVARRRGDVPTLMNYGYAPVEGFDEDLATQEERFGLQLYAVVAGAVDLANKDLLEVGCGQGGGSAFVFERFRPRSLTGLDMAKTAVQRCRSRYARPGLEFVVGDAEDLPFPDATFDAVLSVESSHCYPDVPQFLREVRRVLRRDGLLLLADLRQASPTSASEEASAPQEDMRRLSQELAEAGFETLEREDISKNVVRALQLDTPTRRARIERRAPKRLRGHALDFAAVEGSPMYKALAEGTWTYQRFVLRTGSDHRDNGSRSPTATTTGAAATRWR